MVGLPKALTALSRCGHDCFSALANKFTVTLKIGLDYYMILNGGLIQSPFSALALRALLFFRSGKQVCQASKQQCPANFVDRAFVPKSGREAYAYKCGNTCESIELSEMDSGAGVSKLNAGADGELIQLILNDKPQPPNTIITEKTIDVASKLMKIYCA